MPHQKILQFFPHQTTQKKQRKKNNEVYLYLEKTKKKMKLKEAMQGLPKKSK